MKVTRWSILLAFPVGFAALFVVWLDSRAGDDTRAGAGLAEQLARMFSAEVRRGEIRLRELDAAMARLPKLQPAPFASRYGFRSNTLPEEDAPHWVQFDLGRRRSIDRMVVVPVHIPTLGERGNGYGFPRRFQIEVGDDMEMRDAKVVVDLTASDVPNPGVYPMIFNLRPVEGRYVRFTSTRHFLTEDGFIWALEEFMVLSGNNNIGVGTKVTTTNSLELYPNWARARINDGQSSLGMPVTTEESPTGGYASAVTDDNHQRKTLTVDLGSEYPIDEIRWLPVEKANFESPGWHSFPRACVVEIASKPDFADSLMLGETSNSGWPGFPGHCAFTLQGGGRTARYVRIVAEELWGVDNLWGFAVAEAQVYSNGSNVALGKPVMVTDTSDRDAADKWAPAFAVDGFTSHHRLIEYPEYLELITRRVDHERERDQLIHRRTAKIRTVERTLTYGGVGLGLVTLCGGGWMFVREKKMRGEAVNRLREQIARDLHDDIGSNLGGIVLLSDMGSRHSRDEQARRDFQTILEAAEQTSQSMQDIVWLIESGQAGISDLISRMRRSAAMILGEDISSVSVKPDDVRDRALSLFFLRHFFLAFKETLNNARRHAQASQVRIHIEINDHSMSFAVEDNGVGFDPDQTAGIGHGLANLRRRADRLGGEFQVESRRDSGTRVFFKAPIKPKSS